VVQYAYELAPDIKAVTERKQTVLHAALTGTIQSSTPEDICAVITFLASKGADLSAADASGKKPIALAGPVDGAADLLTKLTNTTAPETKEHPKF
jgi:hypothetical protein